MSIPAGICLVGGVLKLTRLNGGPEIFFTLQGEGASIGSPAVFIRASRCNLHCRWCDTDHSWNFTGTPWPHVRDGSPGFQKHDRRSATYEMSESDAAAEILRHGCARTVITGGEPLLQQASFTRLAGLLRDADPGHRIEVETNGTLIPDADFAAMVDQFNVSPKLSNSGMTAEFRLKPAALKWFATCDNAWFKFVVQVPADLVEIGRLVEGFSIPARRVILMPEGRSSAELDARAVWLAEACRDRGFRFGDRLHVRLWGDRRGV